MWIHLPIGFAKMTDSPFEWGCTSQPIRSGLNRVIPLAQGKVLGAGGSLNAQVFTRGTADDFDGWAKDFGAEGWSMATLVKRELLAGDQALKTDADHSRYVQEHGRTSYHHAGTCAMGTHAEAVVTPDL
jgi:choline dehydrogenase-like flavoprotein